MAIRPASRRRIYLPGRHLIVGLAAAALPVVIAIDLASVALVQLTVPDDAQEAARAGVTATQFERAPSPQVAEAAFSAATEVADLHRLTIDPESFTLQADGTVEFTATRDAPTLLFQHLPGLRSLIDASTHARAERPDW